MKNIRSLEYDMDVYVVGHVSYIRKNDLKLHDDYIDISLKINKKNVGSLRTDGNVQILCSQHFKKLMKDIFLEKGYYPDDIDVMKIRNNAPKSKVFLGIENDVSFDVKKLNLSKMVSSQFTDLTKYPKSLYLEFPSNSDMEGIYPLSTLLELIPEEDYS